MERLNTTIKMVMQVLCDKALCIARYAKEYMHATKTCLNPKEFYMEIARGNYLSYVS